MKRIFALIAIVVVAGSSLACTFTQRIAFGCYDPGTNKYLRETQETWGQYAKLVKLAGRSEGLDLIAQEVSALAESQRNVPTPRVFIKFNEDLSYSMSFFARAMNLAHEGGTFGVLVTLDEAASYRKMAEDDMGFILMTCPNIKVPDTEDTPLFSG